MAPLRTRTPSGHSAAGAGAASRIFLAAPLLCAVLAAGCARPVPAVPAARPAPPTAAQRAARKKAAAQKAAAAKKEAARKAAEQKAAAEAKAAKEAADKETERRRLARLDSSERLVLFAPGGPIIVETAITIDGKPLRAALSDKIENLLAAADADHDGKPQWVEAAKIKDFAKGELASPDEDERNAAIDFYDRNDDGLVDRDEVRAFLVAQDDDDKSFAFDSTNAGTAFEEGGSAVWRLLDFDEDRALSAEEFLAAEERLKSRDADDDDLLFPAELENPSGAMQVPGMMQQPMPQQGPPRVILLAADVEWSSVRYALGEFYPLESDDPAEVFPLLPKLYSQLDADANGRLARDEYEALRTIPPHIELEANFVRTGDLTPGVTLKSLAAELGAAADVVSTVGEGLVLRLPGVKVRLVFDDPGRNANYEQAAQTQLAAYDADKNGYLEKKELPENLPGMDFSFADIDTDKDEKLYPKELAAFLEKQQAPLLKQVRLTSGGQDDALFAALDSSNDGLLSLREMHQAAARLRSFDANGDGRITSDEIPASQALTVARGAVRDANRPQPLPVPPAMVGRPAPVGPAWFVRMDSNVDQDVSLREFLGTPDQFQHVDANSDGFIDAQEAAAVKEEAAPPQAN